MSYESASVSVTEELEDQASQEIRNIFTSGLLESPRGFECLSPPTRTQNPVVQDSRFTVVTLQQQKQMPPLLLDEPLLGSLEALASEALAQRHGSNNRWSDDHVASWPKMSTSC
jgi:hypothetical protein